MAHSNGNTSKIIDIPPGNGLAPVSLTSLIKPGQSQLTINACLGDLPVYDFQVEADTLVIEVEKRLRAEVILPGVIITEHNRAIGVISRRKFFEQLGQLYGVAVYLKRPIKLMLQAIAANPLFFPLSTPIIEALVVALGRPPRLVYDPIIIELEGPTYRLLDVYTLLIAQSRLFAGLQGELKQANSELEARVEQRTAELVQVNADLTTEIAKREQTEEALILARDQAIAANRFKSELLAKVSHELRTPLGGILGHAEMMQVGLYGTTTEEQAAALKTIVKSTHYLAALVSQLLEQAQLEAGKLKLNLQPFVVAEVVQDTLLELYVIAQNKGLALTSTIAPNVPEQIVSDRLRIQQILTNLTSNALKFTEQGEVSLNLFCASKNHLIIQVTDTGSGIPVEARKLIFEPFGQVDGSITRKHGGTGLGLSIVKQLTDLMGGRIELASEIGQGSSFSVILPIQIREESIL